MALVDDTNAEPPRTIWARLRSVRPLWWIVGVLLLAITLGVILLRGDERPVYVTAAIDRGEITRVVSATGALEPLVSVNVGSTVSGPVLSVDVDFNSPVRQGQVLARLDPESFRQRVAQAQAALRQAQASLDVAQSDFDRYQQLAQSGFASPQLIAQRRSTRDRALADVAQARAALAGAETDLQRTIIRSPIDGVVVDRQVNPGQSVAASFQAPTLFVIAQDLSQLQANITVDEADIGSVREGMPVRFTVDAFPDEEFEAQVRQVRQRGEEQQGVVTYIVAVAAPNPDRRLLPGMTANAEIVLERQQDVLRAPAAALRYRPAEEALQARAQALLATAGPGASNPVRESNRGGQAALFETLDLTDAQRAQMRQIMASAAESAGERPGPDASRSERQAFRQRVVDQASRRIEPILTPAQRTRLAALRQAQRAARGAESPARPAILWVLRNDRPEPIRVQFRPGNETHIALEPGALEAGDQVIISGGEAERPRPTGAMGGGPPRARGF